MTIDRYSERGGSFRLGRPGHGFNRNGQREFPKFADPTVPVPLLYGRRKVPGLVVETITSPTDSGRKIAFYLLSEGEIEDLLAWYIDGAAQADVVSGSAKVYGIYWRPGTLGLTGTDTQSEPTTAKRTQNLDPDTKASSPLSRSAYAKLIQPQGSDADVAPDVAFDCEGVKVAPYDAGGAPSARSYSENPILQAIDLITARRYGQGVSAGLMVFWRMIDSDGRTGGPVAYVDEVIDSIEANNVIAGASSGTTLTLAAARGNRGFRTGRTVLIAGSSTRTVVALVGDTKLEVDSAISVAVDDTVVQRVERYQGHLLLNGDEESGPEALSKLFSSCLGFLRQTEGRLELDVERDHVQERITDGGFEDWATASDLTEWTEFDATASATINQETTDPYAGASCLRIDHTTWNGTQSPSVRQALDLLPGHWYVIRVRVKSDDGTPATDSAGIALEWNPGSGVPVEYLQPDGSWSAGAFTSAIRETPTGSWVEHVLAFRTAGHHYISANDKPAGSYQIYCVGQGTSQAPYTVEFDALTIRGPFAGDFRTEGYTPGSGLFKFQENIDSRDREINRVTVKFDNESGDVGRDEAVANDHDHQKQNTLRNMPVDGDAIADRDQARRIAEILLNKARRLGTGARFSTGSVGILVQPGDVILVSSDIPSPAWDLAEKRVTSVEVGGLNTRGEMEATIEVEDYLEAVYTDFNLYSVGSDQVSRVAGDLTLVLESDKNARVSLSWSWDSDTFTVRRYEIHRTDTPGDTLSVRTKVGETTADSFVDQVPETLIDQTVYYTVIAFTDRDPILSNEIEATPRVVEVQGTDPTQGEDTSADNLVFDGDFNEDPTGWTESPGTPSVGTSYNPSANKADTAADNAFNNPTNAYSDDGTFADGDAPDNAPTPPGVPETAGHIWHNFGSGTVNGRLRLRGARANGNGQVRWYYRHGSSGSWTYLTTISSASPADYLSPTMLFDRATLEVRMYVTTAIADGDEEGRAYNVTLEEITASPPVSEVDGNQGRLESDGTDYAILERAYPGETPNTMNLHHAEGESVITILEVARGGAAPDDDVEVVLEDQGSTDSVTLLTIPAADITSTDRRAHAAQVTIPQDVQGDWHVVIRTLSTEAVIVDKLEVKRGTLITGFATSREEQAAGFFGDFSSGRRTGFTKGRWAGSNKISEVV